MTEPHLLSTPELVVAMREGGVTLVDVTSEAFYEHEHLPGAINLPAADIERKARIVLPVATAPIVVHGAHRHDRHRHAAAAELRRLGFRDVREYVDGKEGWILAGLPTARGDHSHT